ncbi:protein-L-isoaspartate O-methyltransferase [Hoeflea sp. TYP-13]|uniref:protein-L-isoaspartate O-methyltransferase n=1 Tax=Hoeflea sp. TYP-13 TaxID=3230023 RepID=UPI0034C678E3
MPQSNIADARAFFARLMAGASRSADPRFEEVVASVPREAFMGPGPWKIVAGRRYVETPDADPAYLYQNVLVALDSSRGINNGEPYLHARWIGCAEPKPGEYVTHIGAGTGYYTAILSKLVEPGGHVDAFEIVEHLAEAARYNLKSYDNVTVIAGDAASQPVAPSDLIYVNAGVIEPPLQWLEALKPGGRMIFPWSPSPSAGLTLLVTAREEGLDIKPLMPVWFIPCKGTGDVSECALVPDQNEASKARSLHKNADRPPDDSAVAIYDTVWFSTDPVP